MLDSVVLNLFSGAHSQFRRGARCPFKALAAARTDCSNEMPASRPCQGVKRRLACFNTCCLQNVDVADGSVCLLLAMKHNSVHLDSRLTDIGVTESINR